MKKKNMLELIYKVMELLELGKCSNEYYYELMDQMYQLEQLIGGRIK